MGQGDPGSRPKKSICGPSSELYHQPPRLLQLHRSQQQPTSTHIHIYQDIRQGKPSHSLAHHHSQRQQRLHPPASSPDHW